MASRSRRNGGRSASASNVNKGSKKSALEFSDDEGSEEEESPLSTKRGGGRTAPASRPNVRNNSRGGTSSKSRVEDEDDDDDDESHRPSYAQDDLDDSEAGDDDEDDDHHGGRGRKLTATQHPALPYSAGSYLPTAYGGAPGGPEMALMGGGPTSQRERSIDRIRARSRDSRRDISKERRVRDRSRSQSQSRQSRNQPTENQKAAERAAERRRSRRSSLEMSLGMMSMDDNSDHGSVYSTASNQQSAMSLINGMDSSFSQNVDHAATSATANRRSQRPGKAISTSLRDSTSTDSTSERRRRQVYKSGKASKTWDGRLDNVLNRQRGGSIMGGGGDGGGSASHARSLSPSAGAGKDKRGGRRTSANAR